MKKLIFILLISFNTGFGQNQKLDWKDIKSKNTFKSNKEDSILLLKYKYLVDSKDTFEYVLCYKLEDMSIPSFQYVTDMSGWNNIQKYENGKHYSKSQFDTSFIFTGFNKSYDSKKSKFSNAFFYRLGMLPLFNKKFYDNSEIFDTQFFDTQTIITQNILPDKKYKRILSLNNSKIYKIEVFSIAETELMLYESTEYSFIHNMSFEQVSKEYNLGCYNTARSDLTEKQNQDSLKRTKRNNFILLDSTKLIVDSNSSKLYILDFWYIGCKPCRQLMPAMDRINNIIDTSKIEIYGVNPYDNPSEINRFSIKNNLAYKQINGSLNNLGFYNIGNFPTILIVDTKLNIIKQFVGYSDTREEEIVTYLKGKNLLVNK